MQGVKDKFSFLEEQKYESVKQLLTIDCYIMAIDTFLHSLFGTLDRSGFVILVSNDGCKWYDKKSCLLFLYFINSLHQKGKDLAYIKQLSTALYKRQELFGGLENAIEIFLKMEDNEHEKL